MKSITTPDQAKRIYLDPRMLPLLAGRRIAVIDECPLVGALSTPVLHFGSQPMAQLPAATTL